MPAYSIRLFRRDDVPAVAELYNRAMAPKKPRYGRTLNTGRLVRQYFGHPEFREDGLFVAESAGRLIGFVFGAVRLQRITPDDALPGVFVSLLLVDEQHRRQGIGTALLERVAAFGRRHGKTLISAHANPMNPLAFWPGVNRAWDDAVGFVRAHGFRADHCEVSMDQSLDAFALSDYVARRRRELEVDGLRIIRYEPRFRDALLAAAGTPFWHLDLSSKVDRLTHPFIETAFLELDRDNIYGPQDVALAVRGDELAGFVALCRNPGETTAYLGPIRIVDRFQKSGLGSVMIQTALAWERERGIRLVDLWCSQENADQYYSRNGFIQRDAWDLYERAL
jgi:GNAT superfamily N-acetyltransferase